MVEVDGLQYSVDWRAMRLGWSVFIPCLDVEAGRKALHTDARAHNRKIAVQIVIEGGVQGIRAWRVA